MLTIFQIVTSVFALIIFLALAFIAAILGFLVFAVFYGLVANIIYIFKNHEL